MPLTSLTLDDFNSLRRLIRDYSGIWLGDDKMSFLMGRLDQRMSSLKIADPRDYYLHVKFDPLGNDELHRLVEAITIQETWFFRETEPIEAWCSAVLPAALKRNFRVRIWSAACSTGEEPYTLAMMVLDVIAKVGCGAVEIVATDINGVALDAARRGVYERHAFRRTAPRYMSLYFEPLADGRWEVRESVKRMVRFEQANILDATFPLRVGQLDAVLCRNMLIYFDSESRSAVLANVNAALRPGGHLILGFSESLTISDSPFEIARIEANLLFRKPLSNGALITEGFSVLRSNQRDR